MSQPGAQYDEAIHHLAEALRARTAHEFGRPDSLSELRRVYRNETARPALRSSRMHRLSAAGSVVAIAAVVLTLVLGINWIGQRYNAATPTHPSHTSAPVKDTSPLKETGSGYSPAEYYPAVNSDGQPVIVRVSDGRQMRVLPRGAVNTKRWAPISPMILSPDGNRVYGVGRQLQDDGKPYPTGYNVDHVEYIDLRTNQFTSLATRGDLITGMTLSGDGTTFAYALRGSQDGQPDRDVIYIHDLVHDTDRHFLLAAGQRTSIMALSPDGSQLAINVNSNSPAVQVMSTTSGLAQPPQQALGAAGCQDSLFGPVQWTSSGLYAVHRCSRDAGSRPWDVVRVSADPDQSAVTVAPTSESNTTLQVRDSRAGLAIFTDQSQGAGHVVTRLGTDGANPVVVPGIRLSGPGA